MHTFEGESVNICHNSDLSGNCIIFDKKTKSEIEVLGSDLIDFVAEFVRNRKISKIEQMSSDEIFQLNG